MTALVKTRSSRRPALATLALAALIVLPPPDLAQASHGGPEVDVIVTYERAPDAKEIARVFKLGARVTRLFFRLPMLVLRVPVANVDKLPAGLGVVSVAPDDVTAATLVERAFADYFLAVQHQQRQVALEVWLAAPLPE